MRGGAIPDRYFWHRDDLVPSANGGKYSDLAMPDRREKSHDLHRIGSRAAFGGDVGLERPVRISKPCFCDPHEVCTIPGPFPLLQRFKISITIPFLLSMDSDPLF